MIRARISSMIALKLAALLTDFGLSTTDWDFKISQSQIEEVCSEMARPVKRKFSIKLDKIKLNEKNKDTDIFVGDARVFFKNEKVSVYWENLDIVNNLF